MIRAAAVLALIPPVSLGDTYLCIPEKASAVRSSADGAMIEAFVWNDIGSMKLLLTNESGKWVVKWHGENFAFFDSCPSEWVCTFEKAYGGVFLREKQGNLFSVSWTNIDDKGHVMNVAKGRCTKL